MDAGDRTYTRFIAVDAPHNRKYLQIIDMQEECVVATMDTSEDASGAAFDAVEELVELANIGWMNRGSKAEEK